MPEALAEAETVKVPMAGLRFADRPAALETLLGSCVGIAVWDTTTGLGGLAHIMLPDSCGNRENPGKFADTAVAELKVGLLRRKANVRFLKAKLAGGATMYGTRQANDIGARNIDAAKAHLRLHGIPVVAQHTGGTSGRLIRFFLNDGEMKIVAHRALVAVI